MEGEGGGGRDWRGGVGCMEEEGEGFEGGVWR